VVRSRDIRFLDGATEPDDDFNSASVPTVPLAEDDPVLADALDPLGRTLATGTHPDECSACGDATTVLHSCDYCPLAHCFSCTDATLPQLTGTWRCGAQDADMPMDRVQEVNEANPFPAFFRTKWGVGTDLDAEESDVEEHLPCPRRTGGGRPTSRGARPVPKVSAVRPSCAGPPHSPPGLPALPPMPPRRPLWHPRPQLAPHGTPAVNTHRPHSPSRPPTPTTTPPLPAPVQPAT
jgi:hypothetical protein